MILAAGVQAQGREGLLSKDLMIFMSFKHTISTFYFGLFSLAQEKTSKTFVISKRLWLFSVAFWEDSLPDRKNTWWKMYPCLHHKFLDAVGIVREILMKIVLVLC